MCLIPFIILSFLALNRAIPIENGIIGIPEVECGSNSLGVTFNTQKSFEGHIYVKGHYNKSECRNVGNGKADSSIEIPFGNCSNVRLRSLNPRGIYVTSTIVIKFHPKFLTKIDRAYQIQCFYMEADKTVSNEIEVSEITTAFQTQTVPMPVCKYEILDGGPTGKPVVNAIIGQQVYHKWTCNSEVVDTFCAVVYSCFVDDGAGENAELINEDGCALDKYLLNNIEYPTDLMAGQETHVYKFTDRFQVFFQCQIKITVKEPGSECERPKCTEPQGFGTKKTKPTIEKAIRKRSPYDGDILDIRVDMNVLDISHQNPLEYKGNITRGIILLGNDQRQGICFRKFPVFFTTFTIIFIVIFSFFSVISNSFESFKQKIALH